MATSSISFRIAQATGLVGAAWLSGNIAALSLISLPALSKSQTHDSVPSSTLTRQWKYTFQAGKSQNPPVAAAVAVSFFYLAWSVRAVPGPLNNTRLYGIAAILTLGIVPWTILAMNPTNQKLLAKAEEASRMKSAGVAGNEDEKEVGDLLKKWTFLNGIRSLLPLLGSAAALVAVLS